MDIITRILEKYFNGESSTEEEKILKYYFNSNKVAPEHMVFKSLFDAFEIEAKESYKITKTKKFFIQKWAFAGSGFAAAVLLTLWLFGSPAFQGDYAIVNGTRINDHELAQQLAESKMNKVGQMLDEKLKPLESIQMVRNSLKPAKKIGEIRDEINNIKQKLIME